MFSPTSTTGTNANPFAAFMQGAQQWNAEKQAKMAEQRCEAMMENMMAGLVGGSFQGGGMQQQRRAPEERVCFHCGEKGHMKWACPKLKAQEKEQWLAEARASGLVKQEPMPPQPLMPATQPAPHSVMGAPHSVGVAHSAAEGAARGAQREEGGLQNAGRAPAGRCGGGGQVS